MKKKKKKPKRREKKCVNKNHNNKDKKSIYFFRHMHLNRKSPVNPISESSGGTMSITEDGRMENIRFSIGWLCSLYYPFS